MNQNEYYIGIDAGGTKVACGLFDRNRNLIKKHKYPSDDTLDGEEYFEKMLYELQIFINNEGLQFSDIKGIGIGIAGYVDHDKGLLIMNPSMPKLKNFFVVEFLQKRIGEEIVIIMDNDCHCGALAEYRRGVGSNFRNMLYCPISTGISSGIVIDGKLFRGSNGISGESGHMLTAVEGNQKVICGCGNEGCFNSLCSGKAIAEHIKKWIANGEYSIMSQIAGDTESITAKHIDAAYDKQDILAIRAVDQIATYMAMWMYNIYMVLNIDCIVFSGGLLLMGDKLLESVIDKFNNFKKNDFPVMFYKTMLGEDSGLIGAVELLF